MPKLKNFVRFNVVHNFCKVMIRRNISSDFQISGAWLLLFSLCTCLLRRVHFSFFNQVAPDYFSRGIFSFINQVAPDGLFCLSFLAHYPKFTGVPRPSFCHPLMPSGKILFSLFPKGRIFLHFIFAKNKTFVLIFRQNCHKLQYLKQNNCTFLHCN